MLAGGQGGGGCQRGRENTLFPVQLSAWMTSKQKTFSDAPSEHFGQVLVEASERDERMKVTPRCV